MIKKIAIIGGGNLGTSIGKGLMSLDQFDKDSIIVLEKRASRVDFLKEEGFTVFEGSPVEAVKISDAVIVSVKPQHFKDILTEVKEYITDTKVLISTVTGVSHEEIEENLGKKPNIRIMPNTAIEIKASMTCLSFSNVHTDIERDVMHIFSGVGEAIKVQEEQLDAVTVIGACGIAFALRFIRAAAQGGIEIGFSAELSSLIAAKTVEGAARLLLENKSHPEQEIDKVTTPQGITISGLNEMEHQGFSSSVIKGILASYTKLSGK